MTDQELIDATLRGDRDAFGLVIQRYQRMVEAAVYSATGCRELVDDVVQDTFVTAWRTIDRLRDGGSLRPWLYGIAKNLGRKARRQLRRTTPVEIEAAAPTQLDSIVERERDREVAAALSRLPHRYREPLVLFYYEHCSVREVADALAMQEAAAMQRLSRGRRKLGEALAARCERVLESKPSRAAVIAAILLLLPDRDAFAAGQAVAKPSWLASHWRPLGGLVGAGAATAVLVAGVSRSNEVYAREVARTASQPAIAAPAAPKLPEPEHDHRMLVTSPFEPEHPDPEHVYRALAIASDTPAHTCARGARTLAMTAFRNDSIHVVGNQQYWEPTPEFTKLIDEVGERNAGACGGDDWPEVYVVCEGTIADIQYGTVSCYPFDVFHDQP